MFIEYLLSQGLYVIPLHGVNNGKCTCNDMNCSSRGKHPKIPIDWRKIGSNNIQQIDIWKEKYSNINWAVLTGRKSIINNKYFIVLDIDQENHEILNKLPETLTIKTGNGFHKYFWSKYSINNSVSLIDAKIDCRGKNGYSIIPPSNHMNGKKYEVISNMPYNIADLPDFLYDCIFQEKKTGKKTKESNKKATLTKKNISSYKWNTTVKQIREFLANGEKIPCGTRNNTCFKLLCSERAKGMKELNDLVGYGKKIRNLMENKENFSDDEISLIANSVLKYPTHDNLCENINLNYIKWLKTRKILVDNDYEKKLNDFDDLFFRDYLQKTSNFSQGYTSLIDISKARDLFYASKNVMFYSRYKPQFLAQKLKNLGFERKRKAKGNFWLIKICV